MSSFWKKALPSPHAEEIARESVVKSSLTAGLGQAVKCLQQEHINSEEPIASGETSNSICNILEAVFIHGLKDTFIRRVGAILSGNVDKIPEPNFWPYLLIFTHKDVISQITDLPEITTDIGRCRAWLRIALNDGLLESYLGGMVKDRKSLQYYYNQTAYLKDNEQPDILRKYVEGLAVFRFKLTCNFRSLNYWPATPLMMAGIWAPPLAPEPVITGLDIASYLEEGNTLTPVRRRVRTRESDASLSPRQKSPVRIPCIASGRPDFLPVQGSFPQHDSISSSPASCPDPPPPISNLDRCRDFEISNQVNDNVIDSIEETRVHDVPEESDENEEVVNNNSASRRTEQYALFSPGMLQSPTDMARGIADGVAEAETSENLENMPHVGNSLLGKTGWSSSFDDEKTASVPIPSQSGTMKDSESFQTLLKNYSPILGSVLRTPNFNEDIGLMVQTAGEPSQTRSTETTPLEDPLLDILEFEIIPKSYLLASKHVDSRTQALIELMGKIQNEKGLDAQNFLCKYCSRPIGMIYGKARVCNYDGCYYCYECHEDEESIIPARILHNWDFKKYKVAKHTKKFLTQVEEEPLLDVRQINPSIYTAIEEMNEVMSVRTQLSYLRSYLFTCRESVAEELRKKIWPKEYLYEHIHLFAISDLLQVPAGQLAQNLNKIVSFAAKHVSECRLCSLKGFICEICNSQKVIYPFQLDCTYRCEECLAVFHDQCMNDKKPCPKCARRHRRTEGEQDVLWSECVDDSNS